MKLDDLYKDMEREEMPDGGEIWTIPMDAEVLNGLRELANKEGLSQNEFLTKILQEAVGKAKNNKPPKPAIPQTMPLPTSLPWSVGHWTTHGVPWATSVKSRNVDA